MDGTAEATRMDGTAEATRMDLLRLNTLRGAKTVCVSPFRFTMSNPYSFYMKVPSPWEKGASG